MDDPSLGYKIGGTTERILSSLLFAFIVLWIIGKVTKKNKINKIWLIILTLIFMFLQAAAPKY